MIRIIIADDHAIVRHGLKQLLALVPDVDIAGEAENGQQLLEILRRTSCDVVLQDMSMQGLNGADLVRRIKEVAPSARILVLSMHNEGPIAARALKAGASGYVTKDSEPEVLISAIHKVAAGGKFIDPALVNELVFDLNLGDNAPAHAALSDREFQIFRMLVAGRSVIEIADELVLSAKTISTYKLRVLQKLSVSNVPDLVRYAIQHGIDV